MEWTPPGTIREREGLVNNVLEISPGGQLPRRAYRPRSVRRVVARRKRSLVFLDPKRIWAFEAADRLTFVHAPEGTFAIDMSLAGLEASFGRSLFRVHRNWLVNLAYVKELERDIGGATLIVGNELGSSGKSIRAPISHDRAKALRAVLLKNATGLRRP
jgi:DNA-binding LytR/AlgR family response regulator